MSDNLSTTVSNWLHEAELALRGADISTARLDSLVLLEDATGKDRGWLLAHPDYPLDPKTYALLETWLAKRYRHIPLAYIRRKAEFYGREFTVNEHTLVPRPETETMIELLLALGVDHPRITDIGTGSGCIAITAALEIPTATVTATDIDQRALATARMNALTLGASVSFIERNLLEHGEPTDIIATNLPYVPDNFQINTAATHEPRHALFGGPDGLELYRALFSQIQANDWKPQYVLTEALPPQHEILETIAKAAGFALANTDDFIQLFKLSS